MSVQVTEIAFVGYPVTDLERARAFYEGLLGLEPSLNEPIGDGLRWIEYDIGDSTLAISNAWPPSGQSGPGAALEVTDLDGAVAFLRSHGVEFRTEPMESPVCRFIGLADPDGNDLTLHQRK